MSKKIVIESCSECPFLIHNNYLAEFFMNHTIVKNRQKMQIKRN